MLQSYRDLDFYVDSYELALKVHKMTLRFPRFEGTELGSQLRRSTKSIPANIAEGWGRRVSAADFKRFLVCALGSCDETRVHLDFARDLGYITDEEHKEMSEGYSSVGKRLNRFTNRWS